VVAGDGQPVLDGITSPLCRSVARRLLDRYSNINPNHILQSLIAVLAGLNIPVLCTETHELGEEVVASYLYQIHLYDWLETNDYGRFLVDNDL